MKLKATTQNCSFFLVLKLKSYNYYIYKINLISKSSLTYIKAILKIKIEMAIWQYLLIVVPENSIDNNYQCIFKNNTKEFLPETTSFWKNFEGDIPSIISELDQIIPKDKWGDNTYFNWKGDGNNDEDNDACICLSADKTRIEEFQFRIDLRKASNVINVLQSILNLCKKNNFVLIDLKGKIYKPKIEDLIESIKASKSNAFLIDSIEFLENLSNEKRT